MEINQTAAEPPNALDAGFLAGLVEADEALGDTEAENDVEWAVRPLATGGFAVKRGWEQREDDWKACFDREEHALLAAAILPALQRTRYFRMHTTEAPEGGFPISVLGEADTLIRIGRFREFDEPLEDALQIAYYLALHPLALFRILVAGGPLVIRTVGRLLAVHFGKRRYADEGPVRR